MGCSHSARDEVDPLKCPDCGGTCEARDRSKSWWEKAEELHILLYMARREFLRDGPGFTN